MDNTYRSSLASGEGHTATTARSPVLARLPDVSDESESPNSGRTAAIGTTNYRFDQPVDAKSHSATQASTRPAALKPGTAHQPHAFGRSRQPRRVPRRESPILPRSNPFAIPSVRLIDTLAPALRFITLVVLFTAAGIWLQTMSSRSARSDAQLKEEPQTASDLPAIPDRNKVAPQPPPPTAAGPLESTPQSGARVGRADADDFIGQDDSSHAVLPVERPTTIPPRFLIANGAHVPRVQTSELPKAQASDPSQHVAPNQSIEADETPSVAQYPGFSLPTR